MARSAVPVFAIGTAPRVNLMPRAAIERRERSALLRRWGWMVALALLVVGLVSGGAYALRSVAEQRLATEAARTDQLLVDLAALQPTREKLSLQTELAQFRAAAMGTDLEWSDLIATVQRVLPEGVAFVGFGLAPAGLPGEGEPADQVGVTGELTLAGPSTVELVPLIQAVREIPSVRDADGWAQAYVQGGYEYTLRLEFDQSVYSGDFASDGAAGEDGQ